MLQRLILMVTKGSFLFGLAISIIAHLLLGASLCLWSGNEGASPALQIEVVLHPATLASPVSVGRSSASPNRRVAPPLPAPAADIAQNLPAESPAPSPTAVPEPSTVAAAAPAPSAPVPTELLPVQGLGVSGREMSPPLAAVGNGAAMKIPLPRVAASFSGIARPPYPKLAKQRGLEGTVLICVPVYADGSLGEVRIEQSSGHEILDQSARNVVRHLRFSPARNGSLPVDDEICFPVKYALD